MNSQQYVDRLNRNIQHINNPQPGDMWEERLVPICLVVKTNDYNVFYRLPDRINKRWFKKIHSKSRDNFRKWLSYGSVPGTWADVHPKSN